MELKINKLLYEVSEPGELQLCLAQVRRNHFSEVWLQINSKLAVTICALIDGEAACCDLTAMQASPRATQTIQGRWRRLSRITCRMASATNTPHSGTSLPNEALRALDYFLKEEKMAPCLKWHERGS